ncbi:MAG: DNA replication and repair protein RecF, partial [Atribacterota bacterium]
SNIVSTYTDEKEQISKIMDYKIKNAKEKDFYLKVTTAGPHRDDYFIMNNEINLGIYGSQGQQRTAVLSLKLAELELLKEKEGEYPPLLLDDVMSELDLERKRFLVQLIKNREMQTFITSINLDDLTYNKREKDVKILRIKDGTVEDE